MSTPVIKGNSAVHLHHTTGRVQVADTTTRSIVRQGLYADLEGQVPDRGSHFEGGTVVSADLQRTKGGMGLLTVTVRDSSSSIYIDTDGDREIVYEVEMAQLEKPILSHPDFSAYAADVDAWRNAAPADRAAMKFRDASNNAVELQGKALAAARLIQKGVESYLVFSPVARRTTKDPRRPRKAFSGIGRDCGKIVPPPGKLLGMASGTWQWLKTADRAVQASNGGSERVEEWTAADKWEETLYKKG
jgi:hypothetical protein